MSGFPIYVVAEVLLVLIAVVALVVLFDPGERITLCLLLLFLQSAAAALWCVYSRNWFTEHVVWSMYLTGIALMALMVRSFLPKPHSVFDDEKAKKPDSHS